MSSGEKAKPPFEERNPFDISRRSGTEVATEIAKRMAAWKQARGRSHAASSTVPGSAAEPRGAKQPAIAAPVQPVRAPKPRQAEAPAQRRPATGGDSPLGGGPRAPFFATFSIQRAMPPAPSPRQADAQPQPALPEPALPELPVASAEPTNTAAEPRPESPAADTARDSMIAAATDEAQPIGEAAQEPALAETAAGAGTLEVPAAEERHIEPPAAKAAPAADADEVERRRAKARDIRARWMAAHDVEVPATVPLAAEPATAPAADAPDTDTPRTEVPDIAAAIPSIEALEDLSGRKEPTLADAVTDSAVAVTHDEPAADVLAAAPAAPMIEETDQSAPASGAQEERAPEEIAAITPELPPIEDLDALSGRKEPVFDAPIRNRESAPSAASARNTKPQIELPAIQTRIEARRIDTLRAEPHLATRRPIFPHIDPEQWDIASPIPTSVQRTRGGTGWAIGLGVALLLIGVTAPAALWQQGRQSQDDLTTAPVTVAPAQPPNQAAPQQAAQQPAPLSPQQSASTASQPDPAPPPAPATSDGTAENAQSAGLPSPELKPDATEAAPEQPGPQQATLGPIRESKELAEAPISAPPPPAQEPVVNLASQTGAEESSSPMVAKPFVPEAGPPPFLRPPTVGGASVPVDGGGQASTVGVKPALIGQLKPKAPAAKPAGRSTPQTFARKPRPFFQQSPEQMFDTLVETLGQGKQPNPTLNPPPPSTRK